MRVSERISPVVSASGMKTSGRSRPWTGCCQRASASTPTISARASVGLRLEVHLDLVAVERPLQLRGEREPVAGVRVALGRVELAPRSGLLRLVHRDIGAPQQLVRPCRREPGRARSRRSRRPGARDPAPRTAPRARRGSGRRPSRANGLVRGCVEDDAELVAAEPRQGVDGPQDAREPRADLAQQLVAAVVAERVVQLLEVVEVDDQHGHALARGARRGRSPPRAAAGRDDGSAVRSGRR